MSRTSGGRGLLLVLAVLIVLAAAVDLLRPESVLVGAWNRINPPKTPKERASETFERFGAPPLPRSNRVEWERTRDAILGTRSPGPA
jgi:hypothetical protein